MYAILFQNGSWLTDTNTGERKTFALYAYAFNVAKYYRNLGARVVEL